MKKLIIACVTLAVLAILVTAPLGALGMDASCRHWLQRESPQAPGRTEAQHEKGLSG